MSDERERDAVIELPPQLDAIDKQLIAITQLVRLLFVDDSVQLAIAAQVDSARAQLRAMAHTSTLISAGLRDRNPRAVAAATATPVMPATFGGVAPLTTSPSPVGEDDHANGRPSPIDKL